MCGNSSRSSLNKGSVLTWEDDGIQILYIELREVLDITPGKSGTLHEHISLLLCWRAFQVIDNMHLIGVGCKYLDLWEG